MIFFLSDGRLGNQLFQYAFLNTLAKSDERIVVANMMQLFEGFDVNNNRIKHIKCGKYSISVIRRIIKPLLSLLAKLKFITYIEQQRNETSSLPSLVIRKGMFPITLVETHFFQSEVFFKPESVTFKIKRQFLEKAQLFLSELPAKKTKVFIHVRRGDYIFEKYLGEQGINLPKAYFMKAIENISQHIENPLFIFLSDDPSYIEDCFENIDNKVISRNDMVTDLAIMSLCDYGVVSNSSFSWWGAYLMNNKKMIIFPKYWYGWKQKIDSHVGVQPNWASIVDPTSFTNRSEK